MNTTITQHYMAMANKMYECRAAAKDMLGEQYHARMDENARVISAIAKRDNCNNIVAGATAIKETEPKGIDLVLLMAAVVEMTEPSIPQLSTETEQTSQAGVTP